MEEIFTAQKNDLLYSPMNGIYPTKLNLHTPFIKKVAEIFFKILEESKIEYYVFAGSSIGLVRNGKSIPWVDDYDIIIFEKDLKELEKVLKVFEKNCFKIRKLEFATNFKMRTKDGMPFRTVAGYVIGTPRYKVNGTKTSFFQLDIFLSKVENNIIRNTAGWGLYNRKDISISWIRPQKYMFFDDLKLPFFQKFNEDVQKEYGDVFNTSVIHFNHGKKKLVINKKWEETYDEFYSYENFAIENTKKLINFYDKKEINNNNEDTTKVILNDLLFENDYISFMRYLSNNYDESKENILNIYNHNNIRIIIDIKYFFNNIKINLHIKNPNYLSSKRFFLEYLDNFIVYDIKVSKQISGFLNEIITINKPYIVINNNLDEANIIKDIDLLTENYSQANNNNININRNMVKVPINNVVLKEITTLNNKNNANNANNSQKPKFENKKIEPRQIKSNKLQNNNIKTNIINKKNDTTINLPKIKIKKI